MGDAKTQPGNNSTASIDAYIHTKGKKKGGRKKKRRIDLGKEMSRSINQKLKKEIRKV